MKYILLFIAVLVLLSDTFGQSITWQRYYNGTSGRLMDFGYDICSTKNGNFYMLGLTVDQQNYTRPIIIKINKYGDTLWSKTFDLANKYTITETYDGGCVVAGVNELIKLDSSGNTVWIRVHSLGVNIQLYDIIQTTDHGFIACGRHVDGNGISGVVYRFDINGNPLWFKIFNIYDSVFRSVIQDNNTFVLFGRSRINTEDVKALLVNVALLIKINSLGDLIYEKYFTLLYHTSGFSINKIENEYILSGATFIDIYSPERAYFIKADTSGNAKYTKIFEDNENGFFNHFTIINNNKYIYVVTRDSSDYWAITDIRITDSTGNILHRKSYVNEAYAEIREILPLSNGDIIMTGVVEKYYPEYSYIYTIRTDSLLNSTPIGIIKEIIPVPKSSYLLQNYPNPFNPATSISFYLTKNNNIKLILYNSEGREVNIILNNYLLKGYYTEILNMHKYSSGVYFLSLYENNSFIQTIKILLIK